MLTGDGNRQEMERTFPDLQIVVSKDRFTQLKSWLDR